MGSYGPPGFWNEGLAERIRRDYMLPVIGRLAELGSPYRGALYCGVMLTDEGPRVLEFNCRFGDPETQVIMPRLLTDPAPVMLACAVGELGDAPAAVWSERPAVGVVMASAGYPGAYRTGYPIAGLSRGGGGYGDGKSNGDDDGAIVFHAGARWAEDGSDVVVTAGGRVLTVVGLGDTVGEARGRAYRRIAGISFEGAFYRRGYCRGGGSGIRRRRLTGRAADGGITVFLENRWWRISWPSSVIPPAIRRHWPQRNPGIWRRTSP